MISDRNQTKTNLFLTSQIVLRGLNNSFSSSVDSEISTSRFTLFPFSVISQLIKHLNLESTCSDTSNIINDNVSQYPISIQGAEVEFASPKIPKMTRILICKA